MNETLEDAREWQDHGQEGEDDHNGIGQDSIGSPNAQKGNIDQQDENEKAREDINAEEDPDDTNHNLGSKHLNEMGLSDNRSAVTCQTQASIFKLPPEILQHVVGYLPLSSEALFVMACKRSKFLIGGNSFARLKDDDHKLERERFLILSSRDLSISKPCCKPWTLIRPIMDRRQRSSVCILLRALLRPPIFAIDEISLSSSPRIVFYRFKLSVRH